jgi:hypothetical protein
MRLILDVFKHIFSLLANNPLAPPSGTVPLVRGYTDSWQEADEISATHLVMKRKITTI